MATDDEKYINLSSKYTNATEPEEKCQAGFHLCHHLLQAAQYDKLYAVSEEILRLTSRQEQKKFYLALLNMLGVASQRQGKVDQASDYYYQMISYAQSFDEPDYVALGYQNLALIAWNRSEHEEFFDLSFRAKDYFETNPEENSESLINLYLNIGERYKTLHKYDLAKDYIHKALDIEKKNGFPARSYMIFGNYYLERKDFALSLGYLKRSLNYLLEKDDIATSMKVLFNIAGQYINTDKFEQALKYLFQLYTMSQKYKINYYDFQLYHYIANCYFRLGKLQDADEYFQNCLNMLSNVTDNSHLLTFYNNYLEYNEAIGDLPKAIEFYKKYLRLYEKVFDEQMREKISVKTAEYELQQKQSEAKILSEKNKIIENQNNELLKLQEAKDNLMYTISHDLKNILGTTSQALEILQIKEPTIKENKYITMAETANKRALTLVGEILYSSKIDAARDTITLVPVDINTVIAEYEESLYLRCKNKNITPAFIYAPQPLIVMLDKDKWHRVFENLCTNAVKFTRPGGEVTIKTVLDGEQAVISVRDNGIGIPPESIPNLFVPFSKVGRAGTAGEESTGLGLSIVKKLVEQHNGTVAVESVVGQGTEFVVRLPIQEL